MLSPKVRKYSCFIKYLFILCMNLFLFSFCSESPLEKALKQAGDNAANWKKYWSIIEKRLKIP